MLRNVILNNAFWLTLSRIFNSLIGYILIILIARNLGDIGLGQYSFIFAFAGIVFVVSDLGLSLFMIKEIGKNKNKSKIFFNNIFPLKLILAFVSLFLTITISFFIDKNYIILLWLGAVVHMFRVLSEFLSNYFKSLNDMYFEFSSNFIERIISLIFGIIAIVFFNSLMLFLEILLVANLIKFLYLLMKVKGKVKLEFKFNKDISLDYIKKSLPFFLSAIFIFLYFRIDTVMLSLIINDKVTGWYNASYRLIDLLTMIPTIAIFAILPTMSNLFKKNKQKLRYLFLQTFRYLIMLAIPIAVGTFILAEQIIDSIYGPDFSNAAISLKILIIAEIFVYINFLMGNLLNSIDKQKNFTIITLIGAVINIILNFILIPKYSFIGAAIATLITEIINYVLLAKYVSSNLVIIRIKGIFKIFISSIVMGIFLFYFTLNLFLSIIVGILIYSFMMLILKLEKEDYNLLKQIVKYIKNNIIEKS